MLDIIVASLFLGAFAGLSAGLFGIGGGLIVVPVLVLLFNAKGWANDLAMIMAVATSLATIILTAVSSVVAHHRLGSVCWDKVAKLTPGIMLGAMLGAVVADFIDKETLRFIFIGYLLYVGMQMALDAKPKIGSAHYSRPVDICVSGGIGLISALLGIGGGTLTVPYLSHCHYPMKNAVAIASACGLPIAVVSTATYMILAINTPNLPAWSVGYIYLPAFLSIGITGVITAPLGAKLAHKLPAKQLKRYFSLMIFFLAAKLAWH